MSALSGFQRLGVFVSGLWLAAWFLLYSTDYTFNWGGFFAFGVIPPSIAWGAWWVWRGFESTASTAATSDQAPITTDQSVTARESAPPRQRAFSLSNIAYVWGACVLGMMAGVIQGFQFGSAEWLGAAASAPILGLIIGGIVRLFRKTTSLPRWMFWWSLIAAIAANANRQN